MCTIELMEQFDSASCLLGRTYGCINSKQMWVDQGCQGKFNLDGSVMTCISEVFGYQKCSARNV